MAVRQLPPDQPAGTAPIEAAAATDGGVAVAPQWKLVWWRFRKHRLAMVSAVFVLLFALVGVFAEFLAPTTPDSYSADHTYAPPQGLHFVDTSGGGTRFGPYVHGYTSVRDPETLARVFQEDESQRIDVGFFVRGEPYEMWGFIPSDRHFIGPTDPEQRVYFLGADRNGRDLLSRIIYGTRISLSIGLVGVALTFVFGIVLGGVSGYFGGRTDTAIQRVIEFLMSIPTIPLWLGLSAAVPRTWGPLETYFAITVILSVIGWTDLARVVRGRFLSLREEDFVLAARLDGCSRPRIILRHMLPSFSSHIIASLTLAIPYMILAETSLSFLGLGLQPPVVSWGVLLQESQNIRTIATAPWLLLPGVAVVVAVLVLNFVGDGVRDSADPYR
ncbi:ABC transporter permease [Allonocardiopsis opalescens]|uniref:Peptide/nickel transport system permease protein n=1 Tax=Allonocardiopsis opalescens TaxID=1144618 RepID=A0A2T0QAL0_9ACTN|nr:ABC transporter permease [Allonocardiopsis opalescens]PRY00894.1 peptide/nickel transport system permease protein [Allonocardiopsis opalescens]